MLYGGRILSNSASHADGPHRYPRRAPARPLLLTVRLSLLLAFSSGVLLDFVAHGAFHEALWFRLAGLLVVGTAICLARAGAALSRGLSGGLAAPLALRRIEGWGFTSVIAVACIVVLMEWKPF